MAHASLKTRTRNDYGYILDYRLRWSDNDMYDHMNNSIYNFLYDSVINSYLAEHCGRHPPTSIQYGLVVSSKVDFLSSISFPAVAELALRVNKLGRSSVTYEIALFERGVEGVKSVASLVHVFVDRNTGRPATQGMDDEIKSGLSKLLVSSQSKL